MAASPDSQGAPIRRVVLRFEDGLEREIEVGAGEYVLDAALRQGIPLVHQCRSGSCSTCVAQIESGELELTRDRALALIRSEIDAGRRLLCSSHAITDSVVRLHYPGSLIFEIARHQLTATVAGIEWPNPTVAKFRLEIDDGAFGFRSGQYVRLRIPGTEEWRSYSMASTPQELPALDFLVRIIQGGLMSQYLVGAAREGDRIEVEGPLGAFLLHATKSAHVFVAGGTGIAPIIAMLDTIRCGSGRRPRMLLSFGCASDQTFFYRDEIELRRWWMPELEVRLSADRVQNPSTGLVQGTPVDALSDERIADPDAVAYLCGPPPMIEAARTKLIQLGIDRERIYAEQFVAT
jgi:ferredoxin-NADP reductase/ferredoxin